MILMTEDIQETLAFVARVLKAEQKTDKILLIPLGDGDIQVCYFGERETKYLLEHVRGLESL